MSDISRAPHVELLQISDHTRVSSSRARPDSFQAFLQISQFCTRKEFSDHCQMLSGSMLRAAAGNMVMRLLATKVI